MSNVLVVDDMAIFREPIAASLRLAGFETVCAANGQEALSAMDMRRPDVILLDLAMPVMDGISFLQSLRARRDANPPPVILLTAMSEKRYVMEAAKLGAKEYLLKSRFSSKELVERIHKHLGTTAKPENEPGPK